MMALPPISTRFLSLLRTSLAMSPVLKLNVAYFRWQISSPVPEVMKPPSLPLPPTIPEETI